MRNLLLFIWKNQFTFLFFLLEMIGFALLTTNNNYQRSKLHTTTVAVSGAVYRMQDSYLKYIGLLDENERLQQENALLREKLFMQGLSIDDRHLPFSHNYHVVAARAINSTYSEGNNFMIIDKGSADGIKNQMGLIGPSGVVGIITHVSKNYAAAMPVIHSQSQISCRLKGSEYFGICRWDGLDDHYVDLEDIPNHVLVNQGDTVITRGSSGIFPAGIVMGFAESTEKDESSGFQSIRVRLATDFRKVNSVYAIGNERKPQLDSLYREIKPWTDK